MIQEMLVYSNQSVSGDHTSSNSECEKCEFCMSITLIHHNEGVTCLECSRVGSNVFHIEQRNTVSQRIPEQIKSHEEILSEITERIGISGNIVDRSIHLFILAKKKFKSKSIADLVLISIFQSYCEKRMFISFYRLKEYYYTQSSISVLNDLFHNLISNCIFPITPSFTYSEISDSLFSYFRIPKKYVNLITLSYTDISKILRYDTTPVKLGCVIQLLSSKNVFYSFIQTHDLLHFLCVKKSTIMVKLRKYKKALLSQNISE
jgi:hypothetical protein